MKYRVNINIIVDDYDTAKQIFDYIKALLPKFRTIHIGGENEEVSYAILERHYHDEYPPKPCEILEQVQSQSTRAVETSKEAT